MTQVEPENPAASAPPPPPGPAVAVSSRVLIVDDDPDLLDVTRFVIESEGIEVMTAKNGEEALEVLRAGELPGLVLLDLMMPVMSGWEFLTEVAKIPSFQMIPVVVLTAAEPGNIPGAQAILRKPVDLGSLIRVVERHTRGRP